MHTRKWELLGWSDSIIQLIKTDKQEKKNITHVLDKCSILSVKIVWNVENNLVFTQNKLIYTKIGGFRATDLRSNILIDTGTFLFVWFDSLCPINNLSVIKGQVFLRWTSTKLGSMCLAQGHNAMTPFRLKPAAPRSRVKHSTTESLRSMIQEHSIWYT